MIDWILQVDRAWFLALNGSWGAGWDVFFYVMSGKSTWIPLYLLIIWLIYRKYGWRHTLWAVVFMGLMVVAVDQVANIFKYGLQKFRPTHTPELAGLVHTVNGYVGGLYGTVSAHAATCFSIGAFSAALFRSRLYTVLIVLWAVVVSYSRIYLGVHFPLDILLGTIDGLLGAWLFLWIFRKAVPRPETRPAAAAPGN